MRKFVFLSLLILLLSGMLFAAAIKDVSTPRPAYATDRIKIKLSSDAISRTALPEALYAEASSFGIDELDQLFIQKNGAKIIRAHRRVRDISWEMQTGFNRWFIIELHAATDIETLIRDYKANRFIEDAVPEFFAYSTLVPNDTFYPNHWGHNNTAQLPYYQSGSHSGSGVGTPGFDAKAQLAWDNTQGMGSSSIIIGIIDSGVDTAHPDLRLVSGYDFGDNDSNPMDDSADKGHGTSCAGVAAARGNNNLGVVGIAGNCSVMPLKVANSAGEMNFTAIENAITYAADNGVHVASLSLGASISYGAYPATDATFTYAYNHGVIIFAATANANTSTIDYPANHAHVISVGAASPSGERKSNTSSDGESWWGSNYGVNTQDASNAVDIMGPTILPTTDISGTTGYSTTNYYMWFNGTSCATPYVAGVAALVLSKDPSLSPSQLRSVLVNNTTDMTFDGGAGWDRYTGYGMVNAYAALNSLVPPPVITWSPSTISESLVQDQSSTKTLHIGNDGSQDLVYQLSKPQGTETVLDESFENGGSIPSGWTQSYVTGSTPWIFATGGNGGTNPSNAYQGSYNARLYFNSNTNIKVTKLITPALDVNGTSASLSFWHTQAFWNPDQDELRVYYKSSAGASWNLLATYTANVSTWTNRVIELPNLSSTYYIAFEGTAKYGYGVCVDKVVVTKALDLDDDWYTVNGGASASGTISAIAADDQISIAFDATGLDAGTYNSNLLLTSNSATNPSISIPVVLEVSTPSHPEILVSVIALDYGYVLSGQNATKDFNIQNPGNATLSGNIICPDGYVVEQISSKMDKSRSINSDRAKNTLEYSIEAAATIYFRITFSPLAAQSYSAFATINHNAEGDAKTISLSAYGTSALSIPFIQSWESGMGDWIAVNGSQTNKWQLGDATASSGSNSIYISNDNGNTNAYNINSASIVHFFRDIEFPVEESLILKFEWKAAGSINDHLKVYITEANDTPIPGTQLQTGEICSALYNSDGIWQNAIVYLDESLSGSSKRLVFSWHNDSSGGTQTPSAVENIRIVMGDNTDIAEVIDGIVSLVPPTVSDPIAGEINPSIQIGDLPEGTVVSISAAYASSEIDLPNSGLTLQLAGASFGGSTITIAHGLGFVPMQIGYRILPSETWILVDNPGDWTDILASFVVIEAKGDGDLEIVFPDSEDNTLPICLSSFTASITTNSKVQLNWVTESETNLMGFYIHRSLSDDPEIATQISNLILANGSSSTTSYAYIDAEVLAEATYYYWLQGMDFDGYSGLYGPLQVSMGSGEEPNTPDIPLVTELLSAYPNPFNPDTNLRYSLKQGGDVRFEIYNTKGQLVRNFAFVNQNAGYHLIRFDGKDNSGKALSSGIYYYKMQSGSFTSTRKMVLMK